MKGQQEKPHSPDKHPETVVECRRCGKKIKVKNLYSGQYCSKKCWKEGQEARKDSRSVGIDA